MKLYLTYGQEDAPEGFEKKSPETYLSDLDPREVTEILGHHILDKIPDSILFFQVLYDFIEVGTKATFQQTYFRSNMAHISPLSIRQVSEFSLSWLSKDWREANKWAAPKIDYDFEVQYALSTDPELESRSDNAKAFSLANYCASITGVQFIITKK